MTGIRKEDDDDFGSIKVFSSEDEKLKLLGELLSNKSSRDIIKLLVHEEHYTNEIASKLDLRPNLVIHHLKKLEELGLLETTNKRIVKKGNEHRHFKINPSLLITPRYSKDEIEKNGFLKKIFKEGLKISVVSIAAISAWFVGTRNKITEQTDSIATEWGPQEPNFETIFFVPIIIAVSCIVLFWFRKK